MNKLSDLANSFIKLKSEGHSISDILEILNITRFQLYEIYNEIKPKKSNIEYVKEWNKNNPDKLKEYYHKRKENGNIKLWRKNPSNTLRIKVYRFKCDKRKRGISNISGKTTRLMLQKKIGSFSKDINRKIQKNMFTVDQLLEKIGENPKCYLTGRMIDLTKGNTYQLDHIIPRSKGGDNSLDNCGLACREANMAKNDLLPEEFYLLCLEVVNNIKSTT